MRSRGIDLVARALARPRSRRHAFIAAGAIMFSAEAQQAAGQRKTRDKGQRGSAKGTAFSRKCRRFIIAAGPNRDDRFQHTDDDLLIEIIPKKGGSAKIVFNDDNKGPNGPNGEHLRVTPFTARVGDQVHIVARNEVAGGCEMDEIWLHCVDGKSGKVKWQLHDATSDLGMVNLNAALGKASGVTAYAFANYVSDKEQAVEIRLGSINAAKVWLNGELITQTKVYHSGSDIDQFIAKVTLNEGDNAILVKVLQNEQTDSWAQDWQFQLRVCDSAGTAILAQNRPPRVKPPEPAAEKPAEPAAAQ